MSEKTGTPELNKALAAVQAQLPKISKDQEGKVEGQNKQGKPFSYSYKYADLADLSAVILPLLGQHGLAFTALPGLNGEGKFGLSYSLLHSSGEEKAGFYPITAGTAQQNGSAITYARRYCLGAVTGVAPAEDDDGTAANQVPHSAGDAWENATPARTAPRQQAPAEDPWVVHPQPDDWETEATGKAITLSTEDDGRKLWAEATEKRDKGEITNEAKVRVCNLISARIKDLQAEAAQPPGEDPWALRVEEIATPEEGAAVRAELDKAHRGGVVDSRRHKALTVAIRTKVDSLAKAGAAA